jgi:hypothetical protein
MYWTWMHNNEKHISWGQPRSMPDGSFSECQPDYSVQVYNGKIIQSGEKVVYMMSGDSTLGYGDSIWLISYLRDLFRIKSRRRGEFHICSSKDINKFYSNYLPKCFVFREEYITKKEFDTFPHQLPAMYYWKEKDGSDKSWVDNRSILERLYDLVGMEYEGLPDFGEFTNEEILYPKDDFYTRLGIDKKDKYVFFQWHSSGHTKNLPPKTNIKLLKHITEKYGLKVYVIGRLSKLDALEKIKGVVNLNTKTLAEDLTTLAFHSEFIVAPDSAGIHLGEAFRIPTVGIYSTLPPVYTCSKYKIPTYMYGSGHCPFKPCGVVDKLPLHKCPTGTEKYCKVLEDVNLDLFDRCVQKTFENRHHYRNKKNLSFYEEYQETPISLNGPKIPTKEDFTLPVL